MKHNFSEDPASPQAAAFKDWLMQETVKGFVAAKRNTEQQKSVVFLFVNRACEARLPDNALAHIYGTAAAQGRLTETEEDMSYDWLEGFVDVARKQYPL